MKNGIRSFVLKFSIMYTREHFLYVQAQLQNFELEKQANKNKWKCLRSKPNCSTNNIVSVFLFEEHTHLRCILNKWYFRGLILKSAMIIYLSYLQFI